ncbi:MAG TPA: DedA family protein [Candidatus Wirthbacteria bacterium]|nr:DedA family protein [Candidatus Wirthbacteria bacterium]
MLGDIITQLTQIVIDLVGRVGYGGLFVGMMVENFFPPLPSDIVLGLAGFMVGQGQFNFWLAGLVATAGTVFCAVLFYYLGYAGGRPLVERFGKYLRIESEDIDYTEKWFAKYGVWVVFFGRFLPIIRTLVSLPAGLAKMHFGQFVLLSSLSTFIRSGLSIYLGMLLGERWELVGEYFEQWENILLVLMIISSLVFIYLKREDIMKKFFPPEKLEQAASQKEEQE